MCNNAIKARFEAILAPDERWMVFDRLTEMPAECDDRVLIGLDQVTAFSLLGLLNGTDRPLQQADKPTNPALPADGARAGRPCTRPPHRL
ncbi:hypothetical protein [Chelativorans sp. M5D2P16]|uniref:hypothetical protein n=1 Tax=Chelativorans sp. M5D2P16 TaxID=3095678 RepID=UPI002ACAEB05|nr:hypothetical protein [Chelativorans sp. M5D2P16]MDZ5697992.1 hypothetical protein [Chelativorans sp. M5D2P16]